MKTARLLSYGVIGILAGLLLENGSLRLRQKAGKKVRDMKKAVTKANRELTS